MNEVDYTFLANELVELLPKIKCSVRRINNSIKVEYSSLNIEVVIGNSECNNIMCSIISAEGSEYKIFSKHLSLISTSRDIDNYLREKGL